MQPAVFIARLAGPLFLAIGLSLMMNHAAYAEIVRSPALIYLSGLLALAGGLAILNVHRAWTRDWRSAVTVLGWLLVIGGVVRIVASRVTAAIGSALTANAAAIAAVATVILAVGAFLSFEGYRQR